MSQSHALKPLRHYSASRITASQASHHPSGYLNPDNLNSGHLNSGNSNPVNSNPGNLKAQPVSSKGTARKGTVKKSTAQKGTAQKNQPRRGHSQNAIWVSGSVATLALLVIAPARVGSQLVAQSSCQEVVQSGAEISRGQISQLLSVPIGSTREAVRQVVDTPYCLLPSATQEKAEYQVNETTQAIAREAYPLAFDPEGWVVLNYQADKYMGYDFVFKP
ncbi:MAG: hypothetical protein HC800_08465 [Phormidesmis sp. RL_2_1]|nr:hypothetical protein [Phormidesmis sp. RL_2_1]